MDKIYIGNFPQGLVQNPLPFNIDNNSFPTMYNFYTWRGRAKRKRGTVPVGRLQVFFSDTSAGTATLTSSPQSYSLFSNINVFGSTTIATLQPASNMAPGTATANLVITVGGQTLTDASGLGTFTVSAGNITAATINYATGVLTLTFTAPAADQAVEIVSGSYYPSLPVMGLEDFVPVLNPSQDTTVTPYPQLLSFDTQYAYQNFTASALGMTSFFNVNYFKNPPNGSYTDGSTPFVTKTTQTPFFWTGQNYQQFWTTNFEQALWATNGNPGVQMQAITTITRVSATKVTFSVASSPAVVGDFVFVNEIVDSGMTSHAYSINGQSGYVSAIGAGTVTVVFPDADVQAPVGSYSGGIMQYLTNIVPTGSSPSMGDGIRWYDGDPTASTGLPSSSSAGWVNFAPPLSSTGQIVDNYSSGTTPFYLVGAKAIIPYKDRILFFGAYIATSGMILGSVNPIYLQDGVVWSWNGAPYYTCSFIGTASLSVATQFFPILTPGTGISNIPTEGAAVFSYYLDQVGFGGFKIAGIQQQIVTVGLNEDVVIVGFTGRQVRLVYTSNDIDPFQFYSINSELGASATFSGITLDRGVITFGTYGFALTTQVSAQRIDLVIPDQAFQISSLNFGVQRISSARDFYKEWLYFSYPPQDQPSTCLFPTQTFFYNYREETWAIFYENFTTHGSFWRYATLTWDTLPYQTWDQWTDSWDSADDQALFPNVVAGTPQGFVVIKGQSTGEAATGYISGAVVYNSSIPYQTQIGSFNHCVQSAENKQSAPAVGDYLYITGCLGCVNLNGQIGQVTSVLDANNFIIDIPFSWLITGVTKAASAVITLQIDPYAAHNFVVGQSIEISGVTGMTELNGNTYPITAITNTTITINVDSSGFTAYIGGGTASPQPYQGLGVFARLSIPLMQSKQFPAYWEQGRQVRVGTQKYLMDNTSNGQVTLNLYLSMDPDDAWNQGPIVPDTNATNNSLIYSQVLYTCPESTNLGLSPANTNLQMPTASTQYQIWHRLNTSLIGDTVQFGITLNDVQMRNLDQAISEVTLHAAVLDIYPGPQLA